MFSKSASLLDLPQKSTIRAIFKAKSVDPKTYSHPFIIKTTRITSHSHIVAALVITSCPWSFDLFTVLSESLVIGSVE